LPGTTPEDGNAGWKQGHITAHYLNSPALLRKTIEVVYRKGSALGYEVVEA
jgi:hypothetical protein